MPALGQENQRVAESASSQGKQEQSDAHRPATTHFAEAFKVDADTYRAICDYPKDKDHADLCQQWRSAEAAETQVRLSGANLVLLLFTVLFTWIAAKAAVRAAAHARDAATAAVDTLEHMRDSSKRELRAYVHVVRVTCTNVLIQPEFQIDYKNTGQTPAYNVSAWGASRIYREPLTEGFPYPPSGFRPRAPIGPGEGHTGRLFVPPLDNSLLDAVGDGVAALYHYGAIRYEDAFGDSHTTHFRFVIGGREGLSSDNRMFMCEEGNDAD